MKTCPVCGASYTARISFCFEDGAVLVASGAGAGDTAAARVSNRVPSRVATPVSPGRRGRSLLSRQGGGLTFSPPRPTPAAAPRRAAEQLTPAPLERLDLPDEPDTDAFGVPPPRTDGTAITPGAPPPRGQRGTPTPASAARAGSLANSSPPPVQPRSNRPDEAELTYDDLDFPAVAGEVGEDDLLETFDDYEYAQKRPAWLIPAILIGAAAILIIGLVFGLSLMGTAALVGGGQGNTVAAAPEPAPMPAPAPVAAPRPAPEQVPSAQPEPAAQPGPSTPEPVVDTEVPEPAVADVAPAPAPAPVPQAGPAPGTAGDGSVWGTVNPTASTVEVTTNPPGAEVWLDGNPIGVTPFTHEVGFGAYTLEVRLEGFETLYDDLMVNTQKTRKNYELRALARSGAVIVVFEGWDGAILSVDGRRAGALPARLTLTEGSHDFAVENSAGETMQVTRDVELSDGGVTIVNLSS